MPGDRLRRFLHLERPRAAGAPAPAEPPAAAGRFGAVARAPEDAAPPASGSGARLERFGPEPEPRLELADPAAVARPGTRCVRCGAENGAFATRCTACDADLDAPEQRALDEKRRAAREEELRLEAAALEERRRVLARDAADEARARRELGESLAREVGALERRRLDAELGGLGWGEPGGDWTPPALRVLRLVRNPSARLAVAAAAIGLPLVLLAIPGRGPRQVGAFLLLFLVILLVPPAWRRRRWRRW